MNFSFYAYADMGLVGFFGNNLLSESKRLCGSCKLNHNLTEKKGGSITFLKNKWKFSKWTYLFHRRMNDGLSIPGRSQETVKSLHTLYEVYY